MPSEATVSAQLRSTGLSFWLGILEWLNNNATPEGLSAAATQGFVQPVLITMSYSDLEILHLNEDLLVIYHREDGSDFWTPLVTSVDITMNQVTAQTSETGNFALQGSLLCPADVTEPDDNYYAASLISPNGVAELRLFDITQDEDWLRWEATAEKTYTIQTSNLSSGVDTVLELYDLDGITLLASNDNGGGDLASRLVWQAPQDGTYFLRVAQASGSLFGCDAEYVVNVAPEQDSVGIDVFLPFVQR